MSTMNHVFNQAGEVSASQKGTFKQLHDMLIPRNDTEARPLGVTAEID